MLIKYNICLCTITIVFCAMAYISYEFFGEAFTTEAIEQTTFAPIFDYKRVVCITLICIYI